MRGDYQQMYGSVSFLSDWINRIAKAAKTVLNGLNQYKRVQDETGVPWQWTGLVHLMERNCDFRCQILNGQRISQVTTLVPAGFGPWASWHESACDAIDHYQLDGISDWSIPGILYQLEKWNGGGYKRRGVNSPYLWSGSQYGVGTGKYGSDGKYSLNLVSEQVGAAVVLKELEERGYGLGH